MSPAHIIARKSARWLVAWPAIAMLPAAHADFFQRDDGRSGIVLTNMPIKGGALVLAEPQRTAPPSGRQPSADTRPARQKQAVAPLVSAAAATHNLPEELLLAVIEAESNFNPQAVSPKGAQGLMQLMPETARFLGVTDAFDPVANIDGGARYLKAMLTRFGNDLPLALAAYNAGPAAVQRNGAIPPYAETQNYVATILRRYHGLASAAAKSPP